MKVKFNPIKLLMLIFLLAVFLAGGRTNQTYRTEGYYDFESNTFCNIEPSNQQRDDHTTSGFSICGGQDLNTNEILDNCEKFDPSAPFPGVWTTTYNWTDLLPHRTNHAAWQTNSGLYLMGGVYSPYTSMLLPPGGDPTNGFDLYNPAML